MLQLALEEEHMEPKYFQELLILINGATYSLAALASVREGETGRGHREEL